MPAQQNPHEDPAHDVLAAEAFAVPSADPTLRHQPITLPDDPTGIAEAHDVLAAEEFAMPAPRVSSESGGALARAGEAASPKRIGVAAAVALLALIVLRRRRRA
jgi:MYXO-CTERM domain-containing protein